MPALASLSQEDLDALAAEQAAQDVAAAPVAAPAPAGPDMAADPQVYQAQPPTIAPAPADPGYVTGPAPIDTTGSTPVAPAPTYVESAPPAEIAPPAAAPVATPAPVAPPPTQDSLLGPLAGTMWDPSVPTGGFSTQDITTSTPYTTVQSAVSGAVPAARPGSFDAGMIWGPNIFEPVMAPEGAALGGGARGARPRGPAAPVEPPGAIDVPFRVEPAAPVQPSPQTPSSYERLSGRQTTTPAVEAPPRAPGTYPPGINAQGGTVLPKSGRSAIQGPGLRPSGGMSSANPQFRTGAEPSAGLPPVKDQSGNIIQAPGYRPWELPPELPSTAKPTKRLYPEDMPLSEVPLEDYIDTKPVTTRSGQSESITDVLSEDDLRQIREQGGAIGGPAAPVPTPQERPLTPATEGGIDAQGRPYTATKELSRRPANEYPKETKHDPPSQTTKYTYDDDTVVIKTAGTGLPTRKELATARGARPTTGQSEAPQAATGIPFGKKTVAVDPEGYIVDAATGRRTGERVAGTRPPTGQGIAAAPVQPPGTPARTVTPAEATAPAVTTFETSRGSVYQVANDGTTTRNAVGKQGTTPGVQRQSTTTVYVEPKTATDLMTALNRSGEGKVGVRNGNLEVTYTNGKSAGIGGDAVSTTPTVGKVPVEIFGEGRVSIQVEGKPDVRELHIGTPITKVNGGTGAPARTVTPVTGKTRAPRVAKPVAAEYEAARSALKADEANVLARKSQAWGDLTSGPRQGPVLPEARPTTETGAGQAAEPAAAAAADAQKRGLLKRAASGAVSIPKTKWGKTLKGGALLAAAAAVKEKTGIMGGQYDTGPTTSTGTTEPKTKLGSPAGTPTFVSPVSGPPVRIQYPGINADVWTVQQPDGTPGAIGFTNEKGQYESIPDSMTEAELKARLQQVADAKARGTTTVVDAAAPVETPAIATAPEATQTAVPLATGQTEDTVATPTSGEPLLTSTGEDTGLVLNDDGSVSQRSGGGSYGGSRGGYSSRYSGGSSYRGRGKRKKGSSGGGFSGGMWEGFPFNRPNSPTRQHVLDAIAASIARGQARKSKGT